MKALTPKQLIRMVEANGWKLERVKGDHYHFKHHEMTGLVTIPYCHTSLPPKTIHIILKNAGLRHTVKK